MTHMSMEELASHAHKFWKENSDEIKSGRRNTKYPLDEVLR